MSKQLGRVMWIEDESGDALVLNNSCKVEGYNFTRTLSDQVHVLTPEELRELVDLVVKESVIAGAFAEQTQNDLDGVISRVTQYRLKELGLCADQREEPK